MPLARARTGVSIRHIFELRVARSSQPAKEQTPVVDVPQQDRSIFPKTQGLVLDRTFFRGRTILLGELAVELSQLFAGCSPNGPPEA